MSMKYTARCTCGAVQFASTPIPILSPAVIAWTAREPPGARQRRSSRAAGRLQVDQRKSQAAPLHRRLPAKGWTAISARVRLAVVQQQLESFPGLVFVMLGSLDRPELIQPKVEMFTKRRLKWVKPLDVPQIRRHAQLN
jgi:hypothetical protein